MRNGLCVRVALVCGDINVPVLCFLVLGGCVCRVLGLKAEEVRWLAY